MAGPGLPTNVDASYADSGGDASVKLHQQHHDLLHGIANHVDSDTLPAGNNQLWMSSNGVMVPQTAPWINVKAPPYNATGNGTTDDFAAIQAAFTAAAVTQQTVYIPAGTYIIGTKLVVDWRSDKPFTIRGSGWYTTLKAASGLNDWVITLTTAGGANVGGVMTEFAVDGNLTAQTAGGCINAFGAIQCVFDHLHLHHPYETALWVHDDGGGSTGHHNRITRCLFDNATGSSDNGRGLFIQASDENFVAFNDFETLGGGGSHAFHAEDASGLNRWIGNVFVGGKEALRIQDCLGSAIIGNMFDGVGGDAIHISGSNHQVTGNFFLGVTTLNTHSHVVLGYGGGNVVTGNTFYSGDWASTGVRSHIYMLANSPQNSIIGNAFRLGSQAVGSGGTVDYDSGADATNIVRNNAGYITEAGGTATVASGQTTIAVTHGLARTPAADDISVTPTNSLGNAAKFWISSFTSTQFTINVNADPGATTAMFAWTVRFNTM